MKVEKEIKLKRPWPHMVQTLVKNLVKAVLGEDVDRLRSRAVASELRLRTLWAASARVWNEHGHSAGQPKDDVEWLDLQNALEHVKPVKTPHSVTAPQPASH